MSTNAVVKRLESDGWRLLRHGRSHAIYERNGQRVHVPHHPRIKYQLAQWIFCQAGKPGA